MKTFLLLILLLFSTLLFKNTFSQTPRTELAYFNSNINNLRDENGNSIFSYNEMVPFLIMSGEQTGDRFGTSVSCAGDVNGDGFDDIIIGAGDYYSITSHAYIFYGGPTMDNIAEITLTGENMSDKFGHSVSSAGDVNGDGFDDVIVGALYNNLSAGRAYIFLGGTTMDNIADVIMSGQSSSNHFGNSVSDAGDVNGDGFDDVVVGAGAFSSTGRSYIFYGGQVMDNIADVVMTGDTPNTRFGFSVSSAGDVNNDGFSDVIVGTVNGETEKVFIFFGGSLMNNIADVIMTGETAYDKFGISVSTAGDVNNDGFDDVIIGAPYYSSVAGRAYICYGGSSMDNSADVITTGEAGNNYFGGSVSSAGDVNNDGYSDIIVGAEGLINYTGKAYIFYGGANMNNESDVKLNGEGINTYFGNSVSTAGDINADGYSDVLVGAYYFNNAAGRAYLYHNLIPRPELIIPINNSLNNLLTLDFKWKKINGSVYSILNISLDSNFNNVIFNDTIYFDTTKNISGIMLDTKYFWRVSTKDSLGNLFNSSIWSFKTIPPIYLNLKILFEGLYSPAFNQLIRKDTATAYLHQIAPPFNIIDSAKASIDSALFNGLFKFVNASTGMHYISIKHLNSIETWSRTGGVLLANDGTVYNYDFTTINSQAYGDNLKLKGSKYCLFSGDVNQDGYITLFDVIPIYNDATNFVTGNYLATDLTGDNIVDLTDVTLCYNNSTNFIRVRRP